MAVVEAHVKPTPRQMRRVVVRVMRTVLLVYVGVLIMLLALERMFIFHPATAAESWHEKPDPRIEDVTLQSATGEAVHAWWLPRSGASGALLYSHGNAGNLSHRGPGVLRWSAEMNVSVLIYDYPGYGRTPGKAGEENCYAAAEAAYQWLTVEKAIPGSRILLLGASLGGSMALDLARRHDHRGVLLIKPFASIPDMAQARFPWLPARHFVRHRFDNLSKIRDCHKPVFITHGTGDTVVPFHQGERLFAAANEPKEFFRLDGHDHNTSLPADFFHRLKTFLRITPQIDLDRPRPPCYSPRCLGHLTPDGDARMMRGHSLTIVAVFSFAAAAPAQAPQFRWRTGQVMTYKVAQTTTAEETVDGPAAATTTQLDLVKRWQVLAVDGAGVATLQMTLVSLRMETKPPTGEPLLFDSTKPTQGNEALREEMAKYIGPPLTVVRVDARGQLVEVKESKFGPASRLESDLPFKLVLPQGPVTVGRTWERTYAIKLEPPQGAGETYDATQRYACKGLANGVLTVGVTTAVKNGPEAAADQLPLLPLQPEGDIEFDAANGRLRAVKFRVQKDIAGHRGEGSKYVFRTTYVEELIEAK